MSKIKTYLLKIMKVFLDAYFLSLIFFPKKVFSVKKKKL